jgi:putative peptidoglycan lipid II flippase
MVSSPGPARRRRLRVAADDLRRLVERLVPRGAIVLSLLSLGYFAAGVVRNRVFAAEFGASAELDAYNAAFRIPEIALDILVGAGLSAPFVPIFTRLLGVDASGSDGVAADAGGDGDVVTGRAEAFGQTVLTGAVGAIALALILLFVAAPWLAATVWSSFDASTRDLYVDLVRINCLAQLLFAASMALGEVLVARRRFVFYGAAPILYTAGIVVGAVTLGSRLGIAGAAWGAVAGAGAHLAARAIGARRAGFRIRPRWAIRTTEFAEFIRLMLPRTLSYPIDPIVVSYLTVLATGVGVGTASALSFVLDYQFVPVQVIAIAFSVAAFPTMSALYAAGDGRAFRRLVVRNTAIIGVLTAAAAIALAVLARPLVSTLLGVGRFDRAAVELTAGLLVAFAVSIPIDSLSYPLSRALYATHNTVWQVIASIAGLAALLSAAQVTVPAFGPAGIAVAYAVGGTLKILILAGAVAYRASRVPAAAGTAVVREQPAGVSPAAGSG